MDVVGRVQLSDVVYDSNLHLFLPSAVVTQIWLLFEQSAFVTQVSLQPIAGVGVGVACGLTQVVDEGFVFNLQVLVVESQKWSVSPFSHCAFVVHASLHFGGTGSQVVEVGLELNLQVLDVLSHV